MAATRWKFAGVENPARYSGPACRCRLMHDANGEPSGLIGYLSDITERIAAAEKQRLNTRLFEYSEEGIYITDAHERIISS